MAITVGGTSITFNDGTTQTTAGGAPTTAQVLSATTGATAGAVGTYAILAYIMGASALNGGTYAGSNLAYVVFYQMQGGFNPISATGGTPAGTWRALQVNTTSYSFPAALFVRVV